MSRWAGAAGLGGILITGQWRGPAWAPPGPGTGCLHTFWLPIDTNAASFQAEGVNLGTRVCKGLQNSQQRLLKAPENTQGRSQSKDRVVSLDKKWRVTMGSESAHLILRLMFDPGHIQGALTRLCLPSPISQGPQKLTATRARDKEAPDMGFSLPGLGSSCFKHLVLLSSNPTVLFLPVEVPSLMYWHLALFTECLLHQS